MTREQLVLRRMLDHYLRECRNGDGIPDAAWDDYWAARELTGWDGGRDSEAAARGLASLDAEVGAK